MAYDTKLTVLGFDPSTKAKSVIDMAEGTAEGIDELIALHNYSVGQKCPMGWEITDVIISKVE